MRLLGGYETWGGYGSSKAALDLISLTLANELKDDGVHVVSVDPGEMRTAIYQASDPDADMSGLPAAGRDAALLGMVVRTGRRRYQRWTLSGAG